MNKPFPIQKAFENSFFSKFCVINMKKVSKTFQISNSFWDIFKLKFCVINEDKVNKTLPNIKNSWEQILTKHLCDQCEQREQKAFKY